MKPFRIQLPAVVTSGILAAVLTAVVGGVWTTLLSVNLAVSPAIPWSVAAMALLLWLMWQYLAGHWAPRSTAGTRRRMLRATRVPGNVFAWALAAGLLSIMSLAGLWIVLFDLADLPSRALPDFARYPVATVALVLIMASLVSSLPEEAGFRGYFQGALERRVSGPAAILFTALVMAPEHAMTQGFVWPTLVFYLCADVMLGALAYLTGSIVPGIVVHSIGLLTFFTLVWPGDAIRLIVGHGGPDTWFWLHIAQVVVFGVLALLAFGRVARLTRAARRSVPAMPSVTVAALGPA